MIKGPKSLDAQIAECQRRLWHHQSALTQIERRQEALDREWREHERLILVTNAEYCRLQHELERTFIESEPY